MSNNAEQPWISKQRTELPPLGRLQKPIEPVGNVGFDGHRDSFISLVYRRKQKPKRGGRPGGSRNDLVSILSEGYTFPRGPEYKAHKVVRRTLSPKHSFQMLYSIADKYNDQMEHENRQRRKHMIRSRNAINFCSVGESIGRVPYIESNTRDIPVEHLKDGLELKTLERIHSLKSPTKTKRKLLMVGDTEDISVHEYILKLRKEIRLKMKRTSSNKGLVRAKNNLRQTNAALNESTKQMYELLHETEHRLMCIQAGGSYKEHDLACQKRREIKEELRVGEKKSDLKFVKRPVEIQSDPEASTSSPHLTNFTRLRNAAVASARQRAVKRKKQQFYEKLVAIYDVLCMMRHMKQPKADPVPLTWKLLRQLRQDPFAEKKISKSQTNTTKPQEKTNTSSTSRGIPKPPPSVLSRPSKSAPPGRYVNAVQKKKNTMKIITSMKADNGDKMFDPAKITWEEFVRFGEKSSSHKKFDRTASRKNTKPTGAPTDSSMSIQYNVV